jgi:hypothetical protein
MVPVLSYRYFLFPNPIAFSLYANNWKRFFPINKAIIWMKTISIFLGTVSDKLKIVTEFSRGFTVLLTNQEGKTVLLLTVPGDKVDLDVSRIPDGIYAVKILAGGKVYTRKIIKSMNHQTKT